jgi:uncharacterized protein (DUF3820 family)
MTGEDTLRPCTGTSGEPDELMALATARMPFGRYRGQLLIDLPEPYVVWFANNGFPEGKLGRMLRAVHEIKVNGLEYLFAPLREGVGIGNRSGERNGTIPNYTPEKK